MQKRLNHSPVNSVELNEEEFKDVYELLRMCLVAEMGIDDKNIPDGDPFLKSCQRILEARVDETGNKHYDMSRGFVPLFERLHNAKDSPVTRNNGVFYRVEF